MNDGWKQGILDRVRMISKACAEIERELTRETRETSETAPSPRTDAAPTNDGAAGASGEPSTSRRRRARRQAEPEPPPPPQCKTPGCGLSIFMNGSGGFQCASGHVDPPPAPPPAAVTMLTPQDFGAPPPATLEGALKASVDATAPLPPAVVNAMPFEAPPRAAVNASNIPNALSQLAGDLKKVGVRVALVDLASWGSTKWDVARAWIEQGAKPEDRPDFLPASPDGGDRAQLVARAYDEGVLTDDTLDVDEAWIQLNRVAPAGWFKGEKERRGRGPAPKSAAPPPAATVPEDDQLEMWMRL